MIFEPMHARSTAFFGNVQTGCLRVQSIMHIAQTISELGGDPHQVFAAVGVSADLFAHPDNVISFEMFGKLFKQSVEATGCLHFGLQLGASAAANPLGLLGEVVSQCVDVGTAIAYLQQNFHLHDRGALATRTIEGPMASIGYAVFDGSIPAVDQISDAAIAIGVEIMRALCGPKWRPSSIKLPHRRPDNVRPYQKFFGCIPEFDAECAAIYFPTLDFKRKIAGADPEKFAVLKEDLKTIASLNDLSFVDQVQRVVYGLVALRRCSLDEVAAQFSTSRRRVNRLLEREGTTYHRIMQDALRIHAERLIVNTDMNFGKIAAALNYADATVFSRAFRGWHGCSPRTWRAENSQPTVILARSAKKL